MDANLELQRWRAEWQRQADPNAAAEQRDSVMRETRRLKIALIAPVLVTLIVGGLCTLRAVNEASPEGWLLLAAVWSFIVVTWVVALFLARGTWRPRADTTAAFIDVAVRRCESALATVPFALALYAVKFTFLLAWKFRYLPESVGELLTAWPTVVFGWVGMPVFFTFMSWYSKRKKIELENLLRLRAQLQAD
jgi:ABC-type phosphate transport system permease subunit